MHEANSVSNQRFEDLVADEERHLYQYDTDLANLEKCGQQYLALQSIERSKNIWGGALAE